MNYTWQTAKILLRACPMKNGNAKSRVHTSPDNAMNQTVAIGM